MSIKIQINSLEALERLLGDEETMEVEVRKSVVEAFAKGFVKSATTSKEIATEVAELKKGASEAAKRYAEEQIGGQKRDSWSGRVTLSDDVKDQIKSAVWNEVHSSIDNAVREYTQDIPERVAKRVDDYMEAYVRRAVNKAAIVKMTAMIESSLDELEEN